MTSFLLVAGRWEKASWTDHRSIDEFLIRNAVVLDVFHFTSFLQLKFLLTYPRKVSVINSQVKKKTSFWEENLCLFVYLQFVAKTLFQKPYKIISKAFKP